MPSSSNLLADNALENSIVFLNPWGIAITKMTSIRMMPWVISITTLLLENTPSVYYTYFICSFHLSDTNVTDSDISYNSTTTLNSFIIHIPKDNIYARVLIKAKNSSIFIWSALLLSGSSTVIIWFLDLNVFWPTAKTIIWPMPSTTHELASRTGLVLFSMLSKFAHSFVFCLTTFFKSSAYFS